MAKVVIDLNDTIAEWRNKDNLISNSIGDLTLLNTTEDSDLVGAINSINLGLDSDVDSLQAAVSNLDSDIQSLNTIIGTLDSLNGNISGSSSVVEALNILEDRIIDVYDNSGTLLN